MKDRAILYGFSFRHHGAHAGFHGLARALRDQIVVDASPPWPRGLPESVEGRLNRRWLLYSEWRLRRYFKSEDPRVIHYFFPENTLRHGADWKGIHRLMATCHQPAERIRAGAENPYYKGYIDGLRGADCVVVQSKTEVEPLQTVLGHDRIVVVPHGVAADFFTPGRRGNGASSINVLTVGAWLRDYALWGRIAREICERTDDIHFTVVTNPDSQAEARRALGPAHERCRFYHNVSDEFLLSLYDDCDILLLPLAGAVANNALLEGMAKGLPVIASDWPAVQEYLGEEAGCTLPNSAVDRWIETIIHMAGDGSKREAMSRAARARAVQQYDWTVIAEHYRRLYHSLATR